MYLAYENFDYDFYKNGEFGLLKRLASGNYSGSTDVPYVIFDVGANVGHWTINASEIFPTAVLHCFEAIQPTLMELKRNTQNRKNITVNEFGLLNIEDELLFKYYPESSVLSGMYDFPIEAKHEFVKGRVRIGDDYVEENDIKKIDFLKIDVEGAENLVLEGFKRSLKQKKIQMIQFEYGMANIITKFLLYDFYRFFKEYGYTLGKIYPGFVEFRDYDLQQEDFRGPNFLAVREDCSDLIKTLSF
jgi:FkbM family methyltransferase